MSFLANLLFPKRSKQVLPTREFDLTKRYDIYFQLGEKSLALRNVRIIGMKTFERDAL